MRFSPLGFSWKARLVSGAHVFSLYTKYPKPPKIIEFWTPCKVFLWSINAEMGLSNFFIIFSGTCFTSLPAEDPNTTRRRHKRQNQFPKDWRSRLYDIKRKHGLSRFLNVDQCAAHITIIIFEILIISVCLYIHNILLSLYYTHYLAF